MTQATEFRPVQGWPGYSVSPGGVVMGACGFALMLRGGCFTAYHRGKAKKFSVSALVEELYPPVPESPVETVEEEWRPLGYFPGYEINRQGNVRRVADKTEQPARKIHGVRGIQLLVEKRNRWGAIGVLLEESFGPGAAKAAGFTPPTSLRRVQASRDGYESRATTARANAKRRCTTCGKPTTNYRCDRCWQKLNGKVPHYHEEQEAV